MQLFFLGVRQNVPKLIFLITDGAQNPKKSRDNKQIYDPVKASQAMIDRGDTLFVVGIGRRLKTLELEAIARDPKKVFIAESIEKLISDEFIKKISNKLCTGVKEAKRMHFFNCTG